MFNPDEECENKVLGIPWNTNPKFSREFCNQEKVAERHTFNICSFRNSVAVPLKIAFQKMCKESSSSSGGDDKNNECKAIWKKCFHSAQKVSNILLCVYGLTNLIALGHATRWTRLFLVYTTTYPG